MARTDERALARIDVQVHLGTDDEVGAAREALAPLSGRSGEDDEAPLSYRGTRSIHVTLTDGERSDDVRIPSVASPPKPGPMPGRPGSEPKRDLDLSNLYTPSGLLGDGDTNLIPDRIDAVLSPAGEGTTRTVDLAARLGLECGRASGEELPEVHLHIVERRTILLVAAVPEMGEALRDLLEGAIDADTIPAGDDERRLGAERSGNDLDPALARGEIGKTVLVNERVVCTGEHERRLVTRLFDLIGKPNQGHGDASGRPGGNRALQARQARLVAIREGSRLGARRGLARRAGGWTRTSSPRASASARCADRSRSSSIIAMFRTHKHFWKRASKSHRKSRRFGACFVSACCRGSVEGARCFSKRG